MLISKNKFTVELAEILLRYKAFSLAFASMLFILLVRIPLGTFDKPSPLDMIAHVVLPAAGAPLLYMLIVNLGVLPKGKALGMWLSILLLGVTAEVVWEIAEFGLDLFLGTNWQLNNFDTMMDIILGFVGSLLGGYVFIKLYSRKL